ncbi:hypothetical protein HanXRQr2_Chr15g0681401 [Helianthus annuus]|uniref:Uncharacterized protein n=1 Tax=Helianthus annuus TaxID=4232 RepID=A0A9K3E028_HELAN|nr:hypothetical protein HanXRQr2_Chr15g0681401 [Helianthus annuus]
MVKKRKTRTSILGETCIKVKQKRSYNKLMVLSQVTIHPNKLSYYPTFRSEPIKGLNQ